MFDLIYLLVLVALGYGVGTAVEKAHYRAIIARENTFLDLPAVTSENVIDESRTIVNTQLAYASVVISTDYFKLLLAGLRNIIGGEVASFETLLDRGRREALLRMKETVPGADIILNMRIETAQITQVGSIEVFAYGTAVYYDK